MTKWGGRRATAARAYFDRVIVRDWTGTTPPVFVAAGLA